MAFTDWSTTAVANTAVGGITIQENATVTADLNDAIRAVMGDLRTEFPNLAGVVTLTHTQINNAVQNTGDEITGTLYFTETDAGNSGAAKTINWTTTNKQKVTLTGNCTFTFTAPTGPTNLVLKVAQDGVGGRTATWPAAVVWPDASAPVVTTTASRVDIFTFYYDGTNYFGAFNQNYTV